MAGLRLVRAANQAELADPELYCHPLLITAIAGFVSSPSIPRNLAMELLTVTPATAPCAIGSATRDVR